MRPGALPIYQQILLAIVFPPIGAILWRFKAGGWASTVQGAEVSSETKSRQRFEFWVILCLLYIVAFGVTIYAWLT